ncbi:MAG TPA: tRNA pseudouridine(55) synthase TruB [Polyangiales bacterium]
MSVVEAKPSGVLVVDKPRGISSHDVVQCVRRALHTRAVGHAGTLDPMATGILVLGVGEGTKLLHHLSADDKTYLATVRLGEQTDSLDADGRVVASAPLPADLLRDTVERAARAFVGEFVQRAPVVSAIKQQGVALYARARRGEQVEAPERNVRVDALEILELRACEIDLRVRSGKGFYVRALARDLAKALGTLGHLTALRRTQSGGFELHDAVGFELVEQARRGDEAARATLLVRLLPPSAALRGRPSVQVDEQGVTDVRQGRALSPARIRGEVLPAEGCDPVAVLDERGALIALGRCRAGRIEIARGIHTS